MNAIQKIVSDHNIIWIPLNYTKYPPVLSTMLDINKLIRKARALHKTEQFNIVHCRSYISAFAGFMLKKKNKTKFIFDIRGFWADERVDGKLWNLKNPLYKLIYKKN